MKRPPEGPGYATLSQDQRLAVDDLETSLDELFDRTKNVSTEVLTQELIAWYREWMKKRDQVLQAKEDLDSLSPEEVDAALDLELPTASTNIESATFLNFLRILLKQFHFEPSKLSAITLQMLTDELGIAQESGVETALLKRAMDEFYHERIGPDGKIKSGYNLTSVLEDFALHFLQIHTASPKSSAS